MRKKTKKFLIRLKRTLETFKQKPRSLSNNEKNNSENINSILTPTIVEEALIGRKMIMDNNKEIKKIQQWNG